MKNNCKGCSGEDYKITHRVMKTEIEDIFLGLLEAMELEDWSLIDEVQSRAVKLWSLM